MGFRGADRPGGDALWRVYATVLLLNAADGLVSTLAPPFLRSQGYPLAQVGLLISAYPMASLAARLPAGRLADGRFAGRGLLVACLGDALALALYPQAAEPWQFWLVRVLHGLSFGSATTLNFAAFLAAATGHNRARATAFYTAAMSAGYSVGNFGSGFLADHLGYGVAFRAVVLFPLLAGLAIARVRPGPRQERTVPVGSGWASLRDPRVRAIPLFAFGISFIHQTLGTLFPLYVLSIGQTLSVAGTARGVQSLSNTMARPFGDRLVRWLGPTGLAVLGVGIYALAIASVPLVVAPLLLVATFAVVGVGRACAVVANTLNAVEVSERGLVQRGMVSTLITAGQDAGAIVAPVVAGAVAGQAGIAVTLHVIPLAMALAAIAVLLSARQAGATVVVPAAGPGASLAATDGPPGANQRSARG